MWSWSSGLRGGPISQRRKNGSTVDRNEQRPDQPSPAPVDTDATAAAPELLARAANDYATERNRREQLSREDRVHGQQPGGAR